MSEGKAPEIQRYGLVPSVGGGSVLSAAPDGDLVTHDDHTQVVARLQARVEELELEVRVLAAEAEAELAEQEKALEQRVLDLEFAQALLSKLPAGARPSTVDLHYALSVAVLATTNKGDADHGD